MQDTEGDVDYINGFVEVYNDPLGYTGSYETIVEIKDFDASLLSTMNSAQWFEDHMPSDAHKKWKWWHHQRGTAGEGRWHHTPLG